MTYVRTMNKARFFPFSFNVSGSDENKFFTIQYYNNLEYDIKMLQLKETSKTIHSAHGSVPFPCMRFGCKKRKNHYQNLYTLRRKQNSGFWTKIPLQIEHFLILFSVFINAIYNAFCVGECYLQGNF